MKKAISLLIVAFLFIVSIKGAEAACTVTAADVSFGAYNPLGSSPVDSTGSVTVTCSNTQNVTVAIGPSTNSGGFNPRKMKQTTGADLLNYNLYTEPTCTTIWGDGTGGTSTVPLVRVKSMGASATVYGRMPAGQDVSVGLYGESLVVTVTY